jgi:hypothetical protein
LAAVGERPDTGDQVFRVRVRPPQKNQLGAEHQRLLLEHPAAAIDPQPAPRLAVRGRIVAVVHEIAPHECVVPEHRLFAGHLGVENLDRGLAGPQRAVDRDGPPPVVVEARQGRLRREFIADRDVPR